MKAIRTFLCLLLFTLYASFVFATKVEDVTRRLSCYCGTCPHLVVSDCGCSVADEIKANVKKMIAAGMTEDQIVNAYVKKYGQTVLAAPPAKGFNLMAWVIPFAGFLAGAFLLALYLKHQKRSKDDGNAEKNQAKSQAEVDDYYREQLRKELEQRT